MSNDAPVDLVSFSIDDRNFGNDDHSELTGPCCFEDEDLSREDDFGVKLAADPYYFYALKGSHDSRTKKREQNDLTVQIVRQQEKLDLLSSKLSRCEVENEALKVENATLIDELARNAARERPIANQSSFSEGANDDDDRGLQIQSLVDANTRLTTDNARLQTLADVMRRSLQSYIKDSRTISVKDARVIGKLRQEISSLRQHLISVEYNANKPSASVHTSKTSAMWSFAEKKGEEHPIDDFSQRSSSAHKNRSLPSSSVATSDHRSLSDKYRERESSPIDLSQHSAPLLFRKSLGSIPEQKLQEILSLEEGCSIDEEGRVIDMPEFSPFGDSPTEIPEMAAARLRKDGDARDFSRRKFSCEELLVNFREPTEARTREGTERKLRQSAPLGSVIRMPMTCSSEETGVDAAVGDACDNSSSYADLLESFGEILSRKPQLRDRRLCQSLTERINSSGWPGELLVDFDTTRRTQSTLRRWSSVKF